VSFECTPYNMRCTQSYGASRVARVYSGATLGLTLTCADCLQIIGLEVMPLCKGAHTPTHATHPRTNAVFFCIFFSQVVYLKGLTRTLYRA
jgi:hypothetical protein